MSCFLMSLTFSEKEKKRFLHGRQQWQERKRAGPQCAQTMNYESFGYHTSVLLTATQDREYAPWGVLDIPYACAAHIVWSAAMLGESVLRELLLAIMAA